MTYEIRWHVTNLLFRAGLWLAPRGAARDTLVLYLESFSDHIIDTVTSPTHNPDYRMQKGQTE